MAGAVLCSKHRGCIFNLCLLFQHMPFLDTFIVLIFYTLLNLFC